ncbi:hypothetical protein SEVIR_9G042750v4 [Setaria viridis]
MAGGRWRRRRRFVFAKLRDEHAAWRPLPVAWLRFHKHLQAADRGSEQSTRASLSLSPSVQDQCAHAGGTGEATAKLPTSAAAVDAVSCGDAVSAAIPCGLRAYLLVGLRPDGHGAPRFHGRDRDGMETRD